MTDKEAKELQSKHDDEKLALMAQVEDLSSKLSDLQNEYNELKKETKTWGISNTKEAYDHVSKNYKIPHSVTEVMVTQDGMVFFPNDFSSGAIHAKEKNLKTFKVATK